MALLKGLEVPTADVMVQPDGTIRFGENSEWAQVASKINMASASASQAFLTEIEDKLKEVSQKQRGLAVALMEALVKALHVAVPEAATLFASVFGLQKPAPSCQATAQKLADMNLRNLLQFDVGAALGPEYGKLFQSELARMTQMFQTIAVLLEWMMKLVC